MIIFAGNVTFSDIVSLEDIDIDTIQSWEKTFFIMGALEEVESSKDLVSFLNKHVWGLTHYDISIESEDELEILSSEYEQWVYECVSFEGADTSYEDILERFAESSEVICVRTAEDSHKYSNKIIKADFIY